jgi:hypothetical protein
MSQISDLVLSGTVWSGCKSKKKHRLSLKEAPIKMNLFTLPLIKKKKKKKKKPIKKRLTREMHCLLLTDESHMIVFFY